MTTRIPPIQDVLLDLTVMVENELHRIKYGRGPGLAMRDCIGQWESTIREARVVLRAMEPPDAA